MLLDLLSKITDNIDKNYETKEEIYEQLCLWFLGVVLHRFITGSSTNLGSALLRLDRNHQPASFSSSGNGTSQLATIAPVVVSLVIDFLQMIETNNTNNRSANDHNCQV